MGWPDTETPFNTLLRSIGIVPKILGAEPNFALHRTEWFDHCRSSAGAKVYGTDSVRRQIEGYSHDAIEEAKDRLRLWTGA